jgi:RHS repeat-associated protein
MKFGPDNVCSGYNGAVRSLTPAVQYAYDIGGSSSNEIRLNQLIYPNGRQVNYNFASGMDSTLNRVMSLSDSSATLASYTYLGLGMVVRITYPQPSVWLDLWGGTSGVFAGLDQFNRVIDQRWQNSVTSTPTDIDRYKYGYDLDSNRQWKQNVVSSAASVPLDEYYTYDNLNRLTVMQRGTLTGGPPFTGISGTPVAEQDWTLDPTGNWAGFVEKSSGTTTLNQTRTASTVNEITNISTTTGPAWVTPAYDAAGNTITMPQPAASTSSFTAVYNAWNRMVSISVGTTPVGKYQYDGRGFRIVKLTYTGGTLSETRDFYFTTDWQDVEEDVSGSMVNQYVWGIRYVDELICRDDATPERLYAAQDANFNLTSICSISGSIVERYLFDSYGDRTIMDATWSVISTSAYNWVTGHQGLMHDPESGLISNRERIFPPGLATWTRRDRLEYIDGPSLYEYERSNPTIYLDPEGNATEYPHGAPGSPEWVQWHNWELAHQKPACPNTSCQAPTSQPPPPASPPPMRIKGGGGGRAVNRTSHVGGTLELEWLNAFSGGGEDHVSCCDQTKHTRTFVYTKKCRGLGLGASVTAGITNMAGTTCNPANYQGVFIEFGGSFGFVSAGAGIGADKGGLTGTNVGSVGLGFGAKAKLMVCNYTLISDTTGGCCR